MVEAPQRVQRSLFGEILDWMLAPLLLLWPMSLGLTWVVAQAIANRPYDRELADLVRSLARQASVQSTQDLPSSANMRAQLQRTAQRRVVVEVALDVGRQALQAARGIAKTLAFHQAVGGQGAGHGTVRVHVVATHGLLGRIADPTLGQQRARQVQRIDRVGGRLPGGGLEAAHGLGPGAPLGMGLAGLPGRTCLEPDRFRRRCKRAELGIGRGLAHGRRGSRADQCWIPALAGMTKAGGFTDRH